MDENLSLGAKRLCYNCGKNFYDLGVFPTSCPNCGFEINELVLQEAQRGRGIKRIVNQSLSIQKEEDETPGTALDHALEEDFLGSEDFSSVEEHDSVGEGKLFDVKKHTSEDSEED